MRGVLFKIQNRGWDCFFQTSAFGHSKFQTATLHSKLLHKETFTQRNLYTEKLLHTETFYTEKLLPTHKPFRTTAREIAARKPDLGAKAKTYSEALSKKIKISHFPISIQVLSHCFQVLCLQQATARSHVLDCALRLY
jgi:hypothetical protein